MEFEFDDSKSQSNLVKHGINFLDAQELWTDPDRVEIPARTEDEARFLVIGKIAQKCWSAVITYRENKVRIISVRRSRKEEVAIYESNRI
ncbi:MAG: BrnT family toxin [Scytonema sp. PMC 1069.18]|nr:BrnT family toxin [Scytonema sp. PMC 1069.18]MEC4885365.1 BrnT family toxin [Scytonema sp. PMC 1070.18]